MVLFALGEYLVLFAFGEQLVLCASGECLVLFASGEYSAGASNVSPELRNGSAA